MSDQIVSGGPVVFLQGNQAYTWVPIVNVSCLEQNTVTDNVLHVEPPIIFSVKEAGKNHNVNTVNHCIFCLRRTTGSRETISTYTASPDQLKEVPCAPPEYSTAAAPLLAALNKIWSHLQKGGLWDWDAEGNPKQRSTQFSCLPKICYYCAANFRRICDLISQLKEEINKLGVIIRESKKRGAFSWRAESFERTLKGSTLDRQCISDTLEFLGIPQENQCTSSLPASYDIKTFGDTMDTEMPVVAETLIPEQPQENETAQGHLDFHDEGSEDDASIEYDDTDNDPNYIKEEEDAFSDSEDSESPTEDFDGDPLDDSKSELNHSLASRPKFSKISTDLMLATSTSRVKTPIQNDNANANKNCSICMKKYPTPRKLREHNRVVHDNNTEQQTGNIVCNICGIKFKAQAYLRKHIKNQHINGKVPTSTCDLCKTQISQKELYEHVRAHVGEEYLIRCPNPNPGQCSFVCCTQRGLYTHLRSRIACRTATPDVNEKYLKPRDASVCQVCGEDLANLLALRNHLNNWHEKDGPKEFPCPIQGCPHRFSWRQSVVVHIASHINKLQSCESQPCDVCKENIRCEEMEQHLKETHHLIQEAIIKCFQCPFLFSDRTNLMDHLYEHRHIALFCDICGNPDTTFYKHNDLRRHYFEVHQIGSKFLCEHCESEYFSARGLEEHLAKRHSTATPVKQKKRRKDPLPGCSDSTNASSDALIADTIFKCDECDGVYKTKQSLTLHKITIHQGKLLPCKFCDQKFPSISKKYAHEKTHYRGPADHIKVMFPCQVPGCGKQLTSKRALKRHVFSAHGGQKSYVCDQCGKAYTDKSGLKTHVESVHMGVRNHRCDICGESFSSGTVLKRHKLIHSGDRPFVCQLCGQKFRYKEVLKRHVEAHERKGADFKPNGPMKQVRKRVDLQSKRKKME